MMDYEKPVDLLLQNSIALEIYSPQFFVTNQSEFIRFLNIGLAKRNR